MTTDVLRVQGDYRVITAQAGTITLDTSIDAGTGVTTGTVVITGDLIVRGATQFGISTTVVEDTNISDRVVTLNFNEPGTRVGEGGISGDGFSGIKIARGGNGIPNRNDYAAFIEWNDNASWQGTGAVSRVQGQFEFRVGKTNPSYSAIKVNAIRIDPNSAPTAGAGAGQGPRLNIFGSDNPTAVISVSGTNNYADRVTDPDDIPNKAYVDGVLLGGAPDAVESLIVGQSYVKIIDTSVDAYPSTILAVINGDPNQPKTVSTATLTGTTVMRLTESIAQFTGVQFVDNEILPTRPNTNLRLAADGTGQLVLAAPLLFENSTVPRPDLGQTGLYVSDPGGGGTGVYFVSSSTLGIVTSDEFTSRKKALIYALIF